MLINIVVTSVGMELSQVLTEDQRKERFSHSLQQKRAHKQMGEEADVSSGNSTSSSFAFNAKAPKLETRTLLQKFLDGRRTETSAGSICMESRGNEPLLQSPKDTQTIVEAEESKMKVREDLAAAASEPSTFFI